MNELRGIGRRDWIWIGGILLLALILFFLFSPRRGQGERAVIQSAGKTVASLALDRDGDYTIPTKDGGVNVLRIRDGMVWMEEADCPNQDCVRMGKKSQEGEMIICLPHKVVVTIERGT